MRTRIRNTGLLLLLACLPLALTSQARAQVLDPDPAAQEAAEAWIAWLEAGDFQTTWDEAGHLFKDGTTAEAWAEQAAAGNAQIGHNVARHLAELRAVEDPPGAPPGEYVHIRYRSEFSLVGSVSETVVLIREAERGWRVIGYFIQPPSGL